MINNTESEMTGSAFEVLVEDEYAREQTCLIPPTR
jgi:hypothetical protein